jgi:hypothetical protein
MMDHAVRPALDFLYSESTPVQNEHRRDPDSGHATVPVGGTGRRVTHL